MNLTDSQIERYSRHIILSEVGGKGQEKISAAKVLVVGAGGLGSPCAYYLAAAGVGTLGILDSDTADLSNLQRQILHFTSDVGRPKVASAGEKLEALNPDVRVVEHGERLNSQNAPALFKEYDLIVDGADNFPTRYLVNDACVLLDKPLIHGSVLRFEGQAMTILPGKGPCYRCLYPEPPPPGSVPSCQEAGVLGPVPGIIGTVQAVEALKLILGKGSLLVGRRLLLNALDMSFRILKAHRDPACPACGENPTLKELVDYEQFCGTRRSSELSP